MIEHPVCNILLIFQCFIIQSPAALQKTIRIGTRPSPLACEQAKSVAAALQRAYPSISTELVFLGSLSEHSGSPTIQDKPLAMSNVDFTSVLDNAILHQTVDLAVHSLKDIPPDHRWCGGTLIIGACLPRACPLDVLVGTATSVSALPPGARVGTSSLRRQAQLLSQRPDLQLINLRGNIQTRLEALAEQESGNRIVDALVLAGAALARLEISSNPNSSTVTTISSQEMLPGPTQGIIASVCRANDQKLIQLLQLIDDPSTRIAATAERAVLNVVDGLAPWDGRPPLAALMECQAEDDTWVLRALVATPNGKKIIRVTKALPLDCCVEDAERLGMDAGEELVLRAGRTFFERTAA